MWTARLVDNPAVFFLASLRVWWFMLLYLGRSLPNLPSPKIGGAFLEPPPPPHTHTRTQNKHAKAVRPTLRGLLLGLVLKLRKSRHICKCWISRISLHLVGGFKFQPIWKICSSNWIIFPGRGENRKYLKQPPRHFFFFNSPSCQVSFERCIQRCPPQVSISKPFKVKLSKLVVETLLKPKPPKPRMVMVFVFFLAGSIHKIQLVFVCFKSHFAIARPKWIISSIFVV